MPQGEFFLNTNGRREFVDLSGRLRELLEERGFEDGLLTLFNPHTTAGLTINEGADPDVQRDMLEALARMVPADGRYRHAEGNSPAHVMASLMGSSVSVIVQKRRMRLGTWQHVFFCEFDGPRRRALRWLFLPDTP